MQIHCGTARERRKFRYTQIVEMRAVSPHPTKRGEAWRSTPGFDKRFWDDDVAIEFVMLNPNGATVDDVAEALGLGKSTVDGLEKRAFRKLLARARDGDYQVREWLFALAQHVGLRKVAAEFKDCE